MESTTPAAPNRHRDAGDLHASGRHAGGLHCGGTADSGSNTDAVKNPADNASAEASAPVTVWFDAACPLCVREIAVMRRLDTRQQIAFIAVQEADVCPLDPEILLARLHARDTDGTLLSGAAAFAAMWRAIPVLRPLGLAARWGPMLRLLELGYLGFLRVRPALQRLVSALGVR